MTNSVQDVWKMVEKRRPDQCWPWLGYTNRGGYGRLDIKPLKGVYAHRMAWAATHRDFELRAHDGNLVLHNCDNPLCCNPDHLYIGTHEQNTIDKVTRNRLPDYSGDKGPRCKLTLEEVDFIRLQKRYGATLNALALLYDVSRVTIKGCISGRHYKAAA